MNAANIARIEFTGNDRQCAVTLKSGTGQEFECFGFQSSTVGGKSAAGWYQMVPLVALKTIEFK